MTDSDLMLLRRLGEGLAPPASRPPADLRRRVMTGVLAAPDPAPAGAASGGDWAWRAA